MVLNKLAVFAASIVISASAYCTQHVTKADKQSVVVAVSNKDLNVLYVDGRKMLTATASNSSALEYQKDVNQGALYFKVNPAFQNTTIPIFITDDFGTRYKIELQPKNMPGEDVVLVPPSESETTSTGKRNQSYQQQIKELIYTMGDDADSPRDELAIDGISRSYIGADIPLWKEANLKLLRRYDADSGMYGELYQIKNISYKPLNMLEQEFYRKGVAAVSVENLTLQPGATTFLYVVREQ
ncbi:type-F conjugative transfer system secretin TraK [Acinetobacter gyllenbergii]|uniref:TraK domain-containing protein n=1 Tax=Acinetobacter gyllenbergii TaxID=134534 RepID=UPI003AF8EAEF